MAIFKTTSQQITECQDAMNIYNDYIWNIYESSTNTRSPLADLGQITNIFFLVSMNLKDTGHCAVVSLGQSWFRSELGASKGKQVLGWYGLFSTSQSKTSRARCKWDEDKGQGDDSVKIFAVVQEDVGMVFILQLRVLSKVCVKSKEYAWL